jgi:hypothetical protein
VDDAFSPRVPAELFPKEPSSVEGDAEEGKLETDGLKDTEGMALGLSVGL